MYIIIGGGGEVGYYLARNLLGHGHEVLLLEKDAARYQTLSEELGQSIFKGDACEARTLEEAGARRADVVIAVTGEDEDNLVVCQLAKKRFNVARTIARLNNPKHEELFQKLGIDVTVSPTKTILSLVESELPG
ncbi:MAG: TrkA family potassium uptake protein, partial [Ktedonobacteraceae bacterium]|nr:TrkA family potassium uptake protein [Ktedonobacteraceae bacterium]